jgi:hypothetical protein
VGIQSTWRPPPLRPPLNIPYKRASCEPSRNVQLIKGEPIILKWVVTTNSIYRCPAEVNSGSAVQSIPLHFATIGSSQGPLAFSILFQYTASHHAGLSFILILHFMLLRISQMFNCRIWLPFTLVFFQQSVSVFCVYTLQSSLPLSCDSSPNRRPAGTLCAGEIIYSSTRFCYFPFSRAHYIFASITLRSILFSLEQWYHPIYRGFILRNSVFWDIKPYILTQIY